jgi:hypothetical protein
MPPPLSTRSPLYGQALSDKPLAAGLYVGLRREGLSTPAVLRARAAAAPGRAGRVLMHCMPTIGYRLNRRRASKVRSACIMRVKGRLRRLSVGGH